MLPEKVKGFLEHDIKVCVLPDLDRLRNEIRPDFDSEAKRGCTITTAMFAFAVLELIGFLMRPQLNKSSLKKIRDGTTENIKFSLSSQADLFPAEYEKHTELLCFFRNGIMHQVFPKAAGIAKAQNESLIYTCKFNGPPNLNVDRLVDDLGKALAKLGDRVRSEDALASQMDRRIGFLQEEDKKELADVRP